MALPIRQGATHKVVIGPVVAVGDGFTPVTTLSVSTADEAEAILHDNGTVVDISSYTFAAITTADGYYHLTLQSGISGTVGHVTVVINDDSLCLPVKADFVVVEEAVYDAFYAASATGVPALAALEASVQTVDTVVDGIQADLDNGTDGLGALKALIDTIDDFIDTEVAAILVDTGTTLDNHLTDIKGTGFVKDTHSLVDLEAFVDLIDDGTSGLAKIASDVAAILGDSNELQTDWADGGRLDLILDAILADSNELQGDWTNGGRLDLILDELTTQGDTNETKLDTIDDFLDTEIAAILEDTGTTLDGRLPAALTAGGNMKADVLAINGSTAAAVRLALASAQMVTGTVHNAVAPTTTTFECDDITEATTDHYKGRLVLGTGGAGGALAGQVSDITGYQLTAGRGAFTVTAMTEAFANDDTVLIL